MLWNTREKPGNFVAPSAWRPGKYPGFFWRFCGNPVKSCQNEGHTIWFRAAMKQLDKMVWLQFTYCSINYIITISTQISTSSSWSLSSWCSKKYGDMNVRQAIVNTINKTKLVWQPEQPTVLAGVYQGVALAPSP